MRRGVVVLALAIAAHANAQATVVKTVSLGAPDATLPFEFSLVTSVRELADGRVLVLDRTEWKVLVADWTRRSVVPVGRNGSGPGEYLQPSTLLPIGGDSTLLPDGRNGRWLMLNGASIAGTIGADAPALVNSGRTPTGADVHGHVIVPRQITAGSSPMPRGDSSLLVRVARQTGKADTIASLKARPTTIRVQGPADRPTSVTVTMNPLTTGEAATLFPDGWIAVARLDPYRVDWIMPDGKRITGAPLPFERVRIDEREKSAFIERQAARSGRAPRDAASFPPWPEIMPPFLGEALLTAPDGRLWIRRAPTAANPDPPYDVIDRKGALVARVAAGKDVQVVGFGRASVFTVATDDNGIQKLQRRLLPKS